MKLFIIAEVDDELGGPLCQHIRDFDMRFPDRCRFNMFAVAPNKSVEEIAHMLNIKPPLQHSLNIKIKDPGELKS
jgi:hypothetical protein